MLGLALIPRYDVDRTVRLGLHAINGGFDTVLTTCDYRSADPLVPLTRLAAQTETAQLGVGVANPYNTHPVSLASRMATLQSVSDGRTIFGLGAGDASMVDDLGIDRSRPLRRVLETMQVARDLWDGDRISHTGTFDAENVTLALDSTTVPIYVGATGPDMLEMSAKYADGVLLNAAHPADYEWASERIETGLEQRSPAAGSFETVAYASVSVATDEEAAMEAATDAVALIVSDAPSRVLDRHGIATERASEIGRAIGAGDVSRVRSLVTAEMIDAFCIAGTPETVGERIAELAPYVDGFVAAPPHGPETEHAIELLASAADRHFRQD